MCFQSLSGSCSYLAPLLGGGRGGFCSFPVPLLGGGRGGFFYDCTKSYPSAIPLLFKQIKGDFPFPPLADLTRPRNTFVGCSPRQ